MAANWTSWEPTEAEVDAAEKVLAESAGYPPDGFWRKEAREVLIAAKLVSPDFVPARMAPA